MSVDLSLAQFEAGRVYGRAYVAAHRENAAIARTSGAMTLRKARAVLRPAEAAILDLVEGRGFTLRDVQIRTGRDHDSLWGTYSAALAKLVGHFEGVVG